MVMNKLPTIPTKRVSDVKNKNTPTKINAKSNAKSSAKSSAKSDAKTKSPQFKSKSIVVDSEAEETDGSDEEDSDKEDVFDDVKEEKEETIALKKEEEEEDADIDEKSLFKSSIVSDSQSYVTPEQVITFTLCHNDCLVSLLLMIPIYCLY